jgi:type I restriction-modification system DNA methylase subunit
MIIMGDGHNNIERKDSLEYPVNEKYDVVLTNYAFSQKTDYASFYEFDTTDANPIFIKHIYDSLKKRWQMCGCCT